MLTMQKYEGVGNDYLILDPNRNELKLEENQIKIQAKNYCWEIRFDPAKQHFRLYKKIWDETIGRTNLIQCSGYDGKEETGQLEKIIALLVGKERTASYPEAYRKAA